MPNNWKCRLSTSCQVDTQAPSVAFTFARRQVEANFNSIRRHASLLVKTVVRGYHVYKVLWEPQVCETFIVGHETGNERDRDAMAVYQVTFDA